MTGDALPCSKNIYFDPDFGEPSHEWNITVVTGQEPISVPMPSAISKSLGADCEIGYRVENDFIPPVAKVVSVDTERFLELGTDNAVSFGEKTLQIIAYYTNYPEQLAQTANFTVQINLLMGDDPGLLAIINEKPEFN